jgi:hypothetical protein
MRIPQYDEAARARGRVLRHVAALDATSGRASVGLTEVEPSHPLGTSTGPTTSCGSPPRGITTIRLSRRDPAPAPR